MQVEKEQNTEIAKVLGWFDQGQRGPKGRSNIDITKPFWSFRYLPLYTVKKPSLLLPLGVGQAEQYGYYKKITDWSSTYDNDMVAEIANPERLVNGNLDFSFLIIFLLPILFIIFTYNINGLEQDFRFEKLISIQSGSLYKWVFARLCFYVFLLLCTVLFFILTVSLINSGLTSLLPETLGLVLLVISYIFLFSSLFYIIIITSNGSSAIAFKMISLWLLLCVIIPGSVHQNISMQHPVNYMTDYLDVNRKEAYEVFKLPMDTLYQRLLTIHPNLNNTLHAKSSQINPTIIRHTVSAIINDMNKNAIKMIEEQNEAKNTLIKSTYWFNPVSFFQNRWNRLTSTDYDSYKQYRLDVQDAIDQKIELLVFACWNNTQVDKMIYQEYLKALNPHLQ